MARLRAGNQTELEHPTPWFERPFLPISIVIMCSIFARLVLGRDWRPELDLDIDQTPSRQYCVLMSTARSVLNLSL